MSNVFEMVQQKYLSFFVMDDISTLGETWLRTKLQVHPQQDMCCREEFMRGTEELNGRPMSPALSSLEKGFFILSTNFQIIHDHNQML